jgi:hypothetical protein
MKTLSRYFHDDNADFLTTSLPVAAAWLRIVNAKGPNLTVKAPPHPRQEPGGTSYA